MAADRQRYASLEPSICEARASACASIYSPMFVTLLFRTVMANPMVLELLFKGFDSPPSEVDYFRQRFGDRLRYRMGAGPGVARQSCARPPSTATSLAVMKLLSDDARKAAAAPTSAGSPMCWSAVIPP